MRVAGGVWMLAIRLIYTMSCSYADSEIRVHDGKPICSQSLYFDYFNKKTVRGGFKSIDFGIAVILVFVLLWEHQFFLSKLAGMLYFWICQNGCKVISIRRINGKSGILEPIKFW